MMHYIDSVWLRMVIPVALLTDISRILIFLPRCGKRRLEFVRDVVRAPTALVQADTFVVCLPRHVKGTLLLGGSLVRAKACCAAAHEGTGVIKG
jgi:hypothetical protein